MQYLTLFVIVAILAIYVIKRIRESFMETSYYYEAAPGARGSRLICMPEARGTASLGIDVNSAASKAVNSCAPLTMTYTAPKPKRPKIPAMCLQYVGRDRPLKVRPISVISSGSRCPTGTVWDGKRCKPRSYKYQVSSVYYPDGNGNCPVGMVSDGQKCVSIRTTVDRVPIQTKPIRSSPGCPDGMVWDGKRCKIPSVLAKAVRTSPGCARGMVWDGKKCKVPSAIRAAIADPSRPKTPKKKGKSIGTPNGKIKYRKIGDKNLPFIWMNGKWVRAKKVNGKWTVLKVTKKTAAAKKPAAKKKSNCPKGTKWVSKKKKCVEKN